MVRRIKRASFAFSQRLCTTWESGTSLSTQACPVREQSYDSCLGSRVFLIRLISVYRHNLTSWPWQHGDDYVDKKKKGSACGKTQRLFGVTQLTVWEKKFALSNTRYEIQCNTVLFFSQRRTHDSPGGP